MNKLFYGDNLDILRRYIDAESIDAATLVNRKSTPYSDPHSVSMQGAAQAWETRESPKTLFGISCESWDIFRLPTAFALRNKKAR